MYLVTFDVTGIQSYVFGSNRVADNIGASALVDDAMRIWTREEVERLGLRVVAPGAGPVSGDAVAFVRRTGGGAQMLLSQGAKAKELVAKLTERILRDASGMAVVADVTDWPDGKSYQEANDAAMRRISARKGVRIAARFPDLPGVVERCSVTGEPASLLHRPPGRGGADATGPVALDVAQRREAAAAQGRGGQSGLHRLARRASEGGRPDLLGVLKRLESSPLRLSSDLDDLRGNKEETSYIAVVHLDGNGMGRLFREVSHRGWEAVATAADAMDHVAADAYARVLQWLVDGVEYPRLGEARFGREGNDEGVTLHPVESAGTQGPWALPFRPIVGAGDDLTFVCEGTIAIALTLRLLKAYEAGLNSVFGFKSATACAGIALGSAHSPFSKLYALAERACKSAKECTLDADGSYMAYRFLEDEAQNQHPTRGMPAFLAVPTSVGSKVLSWSDFQRTWLGPTATRAAEQHAQLKGYLSDLMQDAAAGNRDGPRAKARLNRWRQRGLDELAEIFERRVENDGGDPRINALELMDFARALRDGDSE
jgi:hypothetical protein